MTWLNWVLLAWALVASVALYVCTKGTIFGMPLPFPDRGFRIFVCKDDKAMNTVASIMSDLMDGPKPGWRLDSAGVRRVLFEDRFTILNAADPAVLAQMGNPAAAMAIVVPDPENAAKIFSAALIKAGYQAKYGNLPEVPGKPEAMYYVTSDAFRGWTLILRWSMIRMGKPALTRWSA